MQLTAINPVSASETVWFAFDVAMDTVDLFTEIGGRVIQRRIANRTAVLETHLTTVASLARESGAQRIVVLMESTGRYHESLLRAAQRLGLETAWVNGEAVAKMRVIESNDSGKTDEKDPRVIHTLGTIGKTLIQRTFDEPYSLLRQWNGIYEVAQSRIIETKCALHTELKSLFPDFRFQRDFRFGRGGSALLECYPFNPYRIVQDGPERFATVLRQAYPTIRRGSIHRLWRDAESSVTNALNPRRAEVFECRLGQLWEDLAVAQQRKRQAKQALVNLYAEAQSVDPKLPDAQPGVITALHLARIVAETGPLSDFVSWRKLLRFAGLNLRERKSGTYRGKTKISKKGRALLRKILNQVVLPLVRKEQLFGGWYHHKRSAQKMPGSKAMTAVARKFLKMLLGWHHSGADFDRERVFVCESPFRKAA
jgi:transposase